MRSVFVLILCFIALKFCYSQNPFDIDIYQRAFRKEIITANKIMAVFVIQEIEGTVDTLESFFNKYGTEISPQFFDTTIIPQKDINGRKYYYDSLGRLIKMVNPPDYHVAQSLYEYKKHKITRTYVFSNPKIKNEVWVLYFDKNGNGVKETRRFSDGVKFVFKFKYDKNNLLTEIQNADKTVYKVVYLKQK